MNEEYKAIKAELEKPFAPLLVQWKPGATTKDKKRAMAMPYVESRPYMDRLDEAAPGQWEDDATLSEFPDRVGAIVRLTIAGVTHTGDGECLLAAGRGSEQNAVTSATSQAFKRACAKHGLGRYLYGIPRVWMDYDAQKRCFTQPALAKLQRMLETGEDPRSNGNGARRATHSHRSTGGSNGNGKDARAIIVKMGKHKGLTLGQIATEDPTYIEWLKDNWQWEEGRKAAAAIWQWIQSQEAASA
jgi:hypothetical protein